MTQPSMFDPKTGKLDPSRIAHVDIQFFGPDATSLAEALARYETALDTLRGLCQQGPGRPLNSGWYRDAETFPEFSDIRDAAYADILHSLATLLEAGSGTDSKSQMRHDLLWLRQGGFSPLVIEAYEQLANELALINLDRRIKALRTRLDASKSRRITPRRPKGGRPLFRETPEGKKFYRMLNEKRTLLKQEHGHEPSQKELAASLGISPATLRKRETMILSGEK